MRLTLRTMLAYLDNVLDPADAEKLGEKIKESDFASGLVQRIRTVSHKMRMGAPRVDAKGLAQDANSVAEYLDSALPQDRIGDFERVCLESDVHLAEVAASHQILTMVLGKPADVPQAVRERVYAIGNGSHVPALPVPPAAGAAIPEPVAPPVGSNGKVQVTPVRPAELPDYLRGSRKSRVWPFVATLAGAMLLATLGLRAMGPFDSTHPLAKLFGGGKTVAEADPVTKPSDPPAPPVDETAPPPAPADVSPETTEPTAEKDLPTAPEPDSSKNALPVEPAEDKAAPPITPAVPAAPMPPMPPGPENLAANPVMPPPVVKPIPDSAGPPATVPPVVVASAAPSAPPPGVPIEAGRFVSPDPQVLAHFDAKDNVWLRLEPRSILMSGERLVVLPTFRPLLSLPSGAQVSFVGESSLQLERPLQEGSSRLRVDYGRFLVVTSGVAGAQLELDLAGVQGVATLGDADSAMAVDVHYWLPPGADPGEDTLVPVVEVFATRGKITWQEAGHEGLSIPANHVRTFVGKEMPATLGPFRTPEWTDARSFIGIDRDASILVEAALQDGRPLNVSLEELVQDRRVEVQALAARCLGALDQFDSLFKLLANEKQYSYWSTEIDSLRLALTRGPQVAAKIRETLSRIRPADADRLYRLLWTPSNEQLGMGGEATVLIKNLEDPEMDIRVLTFDALRRITGAILLYRPEKRPENNKVPIQKWKERLAEGQIVYKVAPSPLSDFKPLEKPAAGPPGAVIESPLSESR